MTVDEGTLPAAKQRLGNAVSGLVDPRLEVADGRHEWTDSWYTQLVEAVPGTRGEFVAVACSSPPFWVDAVDLLNEINTAVGAWLPAPVIDLLEGDAIPLTVLRLHQLEDKGWRPQDTKQVEQIAGIVESWASSIKNLLNPLPKRSIPAPCPECRKVIVYRKDSAGELVRQPALQVDVEKCICLGCRTVWPKERFVLLSRVLGYLPDNVDAA